MGRYLLFFSYIGTHFRGMQIQREAGEVKAKIKTVQGILEEKLRKLKPVNEVAVKTSSRTDSNVHALCNACHVDLVHIHHPKREFNPGWITARLNKSLNQSGERLRIHNTVRVPDDFMSRHVATARSYVYRLAVVKKKNVYLDPDGRGLPWAAQDSELSSKVYPPFDVDLFLKAGEVLTGKHNFMSFSTKNLLKTGRKINTDAEMSVRVQRGSAMMEEHREGVSDIMDYWEVHFHGKSFLYRQVRRMMGAMVMVARGKLSMEQLQYALDNPSLHNPGQIESLPGFGLTLKEVSFPESVFNFNPYAPEESTGDDQQTGTEDCGDSGEEPKVLLKETVPVPPWAMSTSSDTISPFSSAHAVSIAGFGNTNSEELIGESEKSDKHVPNCKSDVDSDRTVDKSGANTNSVATLTTDDDALHETLPKIDSEIHEIEFGSEDKRSKVDLESDSIVAAGSEKSEAKLTEDQEAKNVASSQSSVSQ